MNGRFGEDKGVEAFTCRTHNSGQNVIDYAIVSYSLLRWVDNFVVHEYEDLLSDTHPAIVVSLKKKNVSIPYEEYYHDEDACVNPVLCNDLWFKWNDDSPNQYLECFNENDFNALQELLDTILLTPNQENFDVFCNNVNQMFIKQA